MNKGFRDYVDFRLVVQCPHCGRPMVPRELASIKLQFSKAMILATLIKRSPRTMTHKDFNVTAKSLSAYVSHIRAAVHDAGLPWQLFCVHGDPPRYFALPAAPSDPSKKRRRQTPLRQKRPPTR